MSAQRKYPDELRERAVKMVFEIRERDGKGHGRRRSPPARAGIGPGDQVTARCHGRRCGHRFLVTCHAADGSGGHRQNRVIAG